MYSETVRLALTVYNTVDTNNASGNLERSDQADPKDLRTEIGLPREYGIPISIYTVRIYTVRISKFLLQFP